MYPMDQTRRSDVTYAVGCELKTSYLHTPRYYFSGTNIFVSPVGLFACAKKYLSLGMYAKDKWCGKPKLLQC